MQVLIIADDLTGALDSAVAFAGAGLRAIVARRPADVGQAMERRPEVLAVSTASREGSLADARAAVAAALDAAGMAPPVLFKKVDSRLKGHVAAEVVAMAAATGRRRALVAPAIPAQGRIVRDGQVHGAGVPVPIDVAAAFAGSGLRLDVPDTEDAADLDRAVDAALAADAAPMLLVGAAGLAGALARRLGTPGEDAAPIGAPVLLAIGSHDPITVAQMEYLAGRGGVEVGRAPDGACPPTTDPTGSRLLRLMPVEGRPFDPRAAGARFAAEIAGIVARGGVETLFACGGETADAILGALGQGVLEVEGELLPGVPVSTMLIGERKLRLVTKSGGFGAPDALAKVVEAARAGSLEGAT